MTEVIPGLCVCCGRPRRAADCDVSYGRWAPRGPLMFVRHRCDPADAERKSAADVLAQALAASRPAGDEFDWETD